MKSGKVGEYCTDVQYQGIGAVGKRKCPRGRKTIGDPPGWAESISPLAQEIYRMITDEMSLAGYQAISGFHPDEYDPDVVACVVLCEMLAVSPIQFRQGLIRLLQSKPPLGAFASETTTPA